MNNPIASSYTEATFDNRWALIRFAHRRRLRLGLSLLGEWTDGSSSRILDYGCSEGHFILAARERGFNAIEGYDPYETNSVMPLLDRQQIDSQRWEVITCFEVLEHCTDAVVDKIFVDWSELLRPGKKLILSVPIEVGPVAAIKNVVRHLRGYQHGPEFTWRNTLRASLFQNVEVDRTQDPVGHIGFDFRRLREKVNNHPSFRILAVYCSPLRYLPSWFNSQFFMVLERNGSGSCK